MQDWAMANIGRYSQRENRCVLCFWGCDPSAVSRRVANDKKSITETIDGWGESGVTAISSLG
jgi:hypothetical protein